MDVRERVRASGLIRRAFARNTIVIHDSKIKIHQCKMANPQASSHYVLGFFRRVFFTIIKRHRKCVSHEPARSREYRQYRAELAGQVVFIIESGRQQAQRAMTATVHPSYLRRGAQFFQATMPRIRRCRRRRQQQAWPPGWFAMGGGQTSQIRAAWSISTARRVSRATDNFSANQRHQQIVEKQPSSFLCRPEMTVRSIRYFTKVNAESWSKLNMCRRRPTLNSADQRDILNTSVESGYWQSNMPNHALPNTHHIIITSARRIHAEKRKTPKRQRKAHKRGRQRNDRKKVVDGMHCSSVARAQRNDIGKRNSGERR